MKFLIVLFSVLTMNIAHAEKGTIDSYFSPSQEGSHDNMVQLYLQNNCKKEVVVATRSERPNAVWETKGFMRLFPGQVINHGSIINNIFYLYAYTADETVKWEGKHAIEVQGKKVHALLVELPKDYEGPWTTVLNCGNP